MRRELAEGFRYVISVPWIWTGITAAAEARVIAESAGMGYVESACTAVVRARIRDYA
jgi:hypothetical protein